MHHASAQAAASGSLLMPLDSQDNAAAQARSRLPKRVIVSEASSPTVVAAAVAADKATTSTTAARTTSRIAGRKGSLHERLEHTLRRRRGQPQSSLPLREIYTSQDNVPNGHAYHTQTASTKAREDAYVPPRRLWRYQSHIHPVPRQEQPDHDVEKGVANLDGKPGEERARIGSEEDHDRLTFAEWKADQRTKDRMGDLSNVCGLALSPEDEEAVNAATSTAAAAAAAAATSDSRPAPLSEDPFATPSTGRGSLEQRSEQHALRTWDQIPQSAPYHPSIASSEEVCPYPEIPDPRTAAKKIPKWSLYTQRICAALLVICLNTAPVVAYFESHRHLWVLIFIVFVKAKDVLSTLAALLVLTFRSFRSRYKAVETVVPPKTIVSLVSVSYESEEQIMKTIDSIREADLQQHRQILLMILDGKPKPFIERRIMRTRKTIRRPYVTWLMDRSEIVVDCGFLDGMPIIYMQKARNSGKKDSLILCHDIFNYIRKDAPLYTKMLRNEIWHEMLPSMFATAASVFKIDCIFCTDADTTIYANAQRRLIEELHKEEDSIAACGVLFAELDYRTEWSVWSLFQQFQYSFGQLVRRQAEGLWGRVTCLPGCITMIAVRPEMAGAIENYALQISDKLFWRHQVQYLGTDRRLTFSMLTQGKHLRTLFVHDAVSETTCPQSLKHYLNQRRRWGSNAYFNNFFYWAGRKQFLVTRLWAFIDISRMTMVYYRQINNILFIYGLVRNFSIIKIVPLLVITQTPTVWFVTLVLARHPILRRRLHKLLLGLLLNYVMSPILSIIVFSRMIVQLGSSGITWNGTGVTGAPPDPTLRITTPYNSCASSVLTVVRQPGTGKCLPMGEGGAAGVNGRNQHSPDVPATVVYTPSIAETALSWRTGRSGGTSNRAELPPSVRASFHSRRSRSTSRPRSTTVGAAGEEWPLDGAPPVPAI